MAKSKDWKSIVREADPDHDRGDQEKDAYIFSNGRKFKDKKNPYN